MTQGIMKRVTTTELISVLPTILGITWDEFLSYAVLDCYYVINFTHAHWNSDINIHTFMKHFPKCLKKKINGGGYVDLTTLIYPTAFDSSREVKYNIARFIVEEALKNEARHPSK